jgi:hypothetical protein
MASMAESQFRRLVQEVQGDEAVVGLVLGGSRGKRFETADSDHDVYLIVRQGALVAWRARFPQQRTGFGDLILLTEGEFAGFAAWGSETHWARYGFARAQVLVDRDGTIAPLVAAKGMVPPELRLPLVRGALGAYINGVFRSAKCWRKGNSLGARLEAADSLGHLLTIVFALEGRHAPYYGYLDRELRAVPLASLPLAADELLGAFDAILATGDLAIQQRLLGVVERLCRAAGLDDVFDEHWGADYPWIKTFQPT